MREHDFGNFLCALRVGRGLSQYQLGALVGVTDKAVSKWENGTAKPRLQTCQRIADVLGVSTSELLSCQYQSTYSVRKQEAPVREKLIEQAYEQLHRIYGPEPPIEIWSRLETELAVLRDSEALIGIGFLSEFAKLTKTEKGCMTVRGTVASSFTAWLLGVTPVNPLPPHYVCPKCRKVRLCRSAEDGFDLPAEVCGCGTALRRDGHSIPFDSYASTISKHQSFELNISAGMERFAADALRRYYQKTGRILPVAIDQPMAPPEWRRVIWYVVLPPERSMPILDEDGFLHISSSAFYANYGGFPSYLFLPAPAESRLEELRKQHREPTMEECLAPDVLRRLQRTRREERPLFAEIITGNDAVRFSLLSRADGLCCATDAWQGNGDELVRSGIADVRELAAFREDVWDMIIARVSPQALSGTGLPAKIMDDVRLGRYRRNGMSDEVRSLLRRLDIPEWYIGHISKIVYVFPKSHCVSFLMRDLKLAWYQEHCPEQF